MRIFRLSVVVAILLSTVCSPALIGVEEEREQKPSLMKRKLQHSQHLLKRITQKDFKLIAKSASELVDISRQAEWREFKTPMYEQYSDQFRRQALEMMSNAKDHKLDSVTLNYFELTLTCVRCHEDIRKAKMTRVFPNPPDRIEGEFTLKTR